MEVPGSESRVAELEEVLTEYGFGVKKLTGYAVEPVLPYAAHGEKFAPPTRLQKKVLLVAIALANAPAWPVAT